MIRIIIVAAAVIFSALVLVGWFGGTPSDSATAVTIAELRANPGQWNGEQVQVSGVVGGRMFVMGYGGLKLHSDQGNEILVVGAASPVPLGESMTVEGMFVTTFAIGSLTMPVILVGGS